ncbi:MAG TPA: endonuclease/exonuclease/phosphatase family protein [Terriglobia bacterium]|nr:endonuclease/exonuclease/phosphatase family protein [Terriglobia bacterium]
MRSSRANGHSQPRFVQVVAAIAIAVLFTSIPAWSQDVGGKRELDVATVNLYVGADVSAITTLDPTDPAYGVKLITAVATVHARILASGFPQRAAALAQEIVARGPDVVALQEVSLLRRQSPGDSIIGGIIPATQVELDYLQILLDALHRYGGHYVVVSQVDNTDVELPLATSAFTFDDVRLTDRDVILARTDLPPGQLRVASPLHANFAARLPLPTGVTVKRGWCSIDVQMRGRWFRVINTHLEEQLPPGLPNIQGFQAAELLAVPANVDAPVVLVGDFNSDANGNYSPATYALLTGPGHFSDAWSEANRNQPGLTWGHDDLLADKNHLFSLRLDLVLFRGAGFAAGGAAVVDPVIRSLPPFWFSDHGAVFATIRIR